MNTFYKSERRYGCEEPIKMNNVMSLEAILVMKKQLILI